MSEPSGRPNIHISQYVIFSRCSCITYLFEKGAEHTLWKGDIAQGHNPHRLEPNGAKVADELTPLALESQHVVIVTRQQAK